MPDEKTILIVGATSDERLRMAARDAAAQWPGSRIHLLRPAERPPWPESDPDVHRITQAASREIQPEDISTSGKFDLAVLAIAHVGRFAYPELVRQCAAVAPDCRLYSGQGRQRLDARDAETGWPSEPIAHKSFVADRRPRSWVFFRPSDRTARHIAAAWRDQGAVVREAETLAELETLVPQTDAVFFDWCITHYHALFQAVAMAGEHGKRREALISLDLADLAENPDTARRLIRLNRSALPRMDRIHYLASRSFLLDRYGLDVDQAKAWWNQADSQQWTRPVSPQNRPNDAPVRIVYHGLFYYWHEVAEFLPVLKRLTDRRPVRFDLFGRVHESLSIGGESLFPEKERRVREALRQLEKMPGVVCHSFAAPATIVQAMAKADFYLGITAGNTRMSLTEIRTGEEEAMLTGIRILRKRTPASDLRGWKPGQDYVAIDANQPEAAVAAIIEAFENG